MRPLSAAQLLDAWERGLSEPSWRRVFPMLAAAYLDCSFDALAALSIGERDRRLLTLRPLPFGSRLASVANCTQCGVSFAWTLDTTDLVMQSPAGPPASLSLDVDDYRVRF